MGLSAEHPRLLSLDLFGRLRIPGPRTFRNLLIRGLRCSGQLCDLTFAAKGRRVLDATGTRPRRSPSRDTHACITIDCHRVWLQGHRVFTDLMVLKRNAA